MLSLSPMALSDAGRRVIAGAWPQGRSALLISVKRGNAAAARHKLGLRGLAVVAETHDLQNPYKAD